MRQIIFNLRDETQTNVLGAALAHVLKPGMKLYLHGDLGSGKTTLTRALIQEAGHPGQIKSPTYALAEPYSIQLNQKTVALLHFDLYRMVDAEEFLDAGFREHFEDDTVCIVEWAEKANDILPPPDIHIYFYINGLGRKVKLQALSEQGSDSLSYLRFDTDE